MPAAAPHFGRFIGELSPVAVITAASIVGGLCLGLLRTLDGFAVMEGRETLKGIGISALAATVRGCLAIGIDLVFRYPAGINVPVPQALLFYPAVGLVAEVVFHLVPLTLLLLVTKPLRSRFGQNRLTIAAIALVTIAEPVFQAMFDVDPFSGRSIATFFNVSLIAGLQLLVFRRFDFVTMYAFRMIYYTYWHIIWGVIRLQVLFHA